MKTPERFILVDDDPADNIIFKLCVKKTFDKCETVIFNVPEEGLAFLESEIKTLMTISPTVLFLDINMPTLSGWQFLEKYEQIESSNKDEISIYMLSSSVDNRDIEKANSHPVVKGYIVKPLSKQVLQNLFGE
jgi:CheY-like chemotaxis protein